MARAAYLDGNRLEDVIFLIQYLGLGESFSLADGVTPFSVSPSSAKRWSDIARDHPEFFRLTEANTSALSLRYYLRQVGGNPAPISIDLVQQLVQNAMALHERQAKRVELWKSWVTMVAAVAAAISGIANLYVR